MKILIISGEVSGDMLASGLIKSLKKINPDTHYFAMGGIGSKSAGAELIADISELSVMGFTEVLLKIRKIYAIFNKVSGWIKANRPDAIILVDFPSFNFKIAKLSYKLKIPVIYFIPPKIWASRYNRIDFIKRYIKFVIVIFPFELEIYKNKGIEAYYFGNPLYSRYESEYLNELGKGNNIFDCRIDSETRPVIACLPGSRRSELKYHTKRIIKSMKLIKSEYKNSLFIIPFRKGIDNSYFISMLKAKNIPEDWVCLTDSVEYAFKTADLIIVASGTASLEAAFFKKPMIIVYYLNYLTYLLARIMVRVDYVGLINILAGKLVIPELIESRFNPGNVFNYVEKILKNNAYSDNMIKEISDMVLSLKTDYDTFDASAKLIYDKINRIPFHRITQN